MITFTHKNSEIKNQNIIVYVSTQKELSQLDFLQLDTNILKDIKKHITAKKSSLQEYFLGTSQCNKLHILIAREKTHEDNINFL
jgi:hypothetical protein